MKIVVLDGYTLNPGDLSWEDIEKCGDLTVYERSLPGEIVDRCQDASIVLTNKTPLTREALQALPALKLVSVLATGYNIVDVAAARELGIDVANIPAYGTASVVQLTFAMMLEYFNGVSLHNSAVRSGEWANCRDFSFSKSPLHELKNKTIGIIGFGTIGKQVCDVATVFEVRTLAYSRTRTDQQHRRNFAWVDLNTLMSQSDIITIHCPLTEETRGLINKSTLAMMKSNVLLINTARGPIINEADLATALNAGTIAAAALDVLSMEPPSEDNPLLTARNCIITPHIGWATFEARSRLMQATVENIKSFIAGRPVNLVN